MLFKEERNISYCNKNQTGMEVETTTGADTSAAELSAALNIKKEKRKFNSKLYGRTIQKGFAKLYKDDALSDLTLIVGDEKIPVHRMVKSKIHLYRFVNFLNFRCCAHGRRHLEQCLKRVRLGRKPHKRNWR